MQRDDGTSNDECRGRLGITEMDEQKVVTRINAGEAAGSYENKYEGELAITTNNV
jgi:hypothetical protein